MGKEICQPASTEGFYNQQWVGSQSSPWTRAQVPTVMICLMKYLLLAPFPCWSHFPILLPVFSGSISYVIELVFFVCLGFCFVWDRVSLCSLAGFKIMILLPQPPQCWNLSLAFWSRVDHQAPVAHACNPSYWNGRDQENLGSRPAQADSLWDPISKMPDRVTQVVESLPSKHEALSSNPTTAKKKKERKKQSRSINGLFWKEHHKILLSEQAFYRTICMV
jgi:hypothetical protein